MDDSYHPEPKVTSKRVAIQRISPPEYPTGAPFDPDKQYPELQFVENTSPRINRVYEGIRNILLRLDLDAQNRESSHWNPLGDLVPEGGSVVIKPNLVSEARDSITNPESIVTHASVIRPLLDYAIKAVGENGSVIIADAPQFDSDFDDIVSTNGLSQTLEILSKRYGSKLPLLDLRAERVTVQKGIIVSRERLCGDPKGYSIVDLASGSRLVEIDNYSSRYRGSDYDRSVTIAHHTNGKHEFCISNTLLAADLVISIPKLKTHKKAGVTLNLKNLVGING
ncbi:DUF362 domain-containing protein, partial [Candidatus Bathyarchaeota archaeon]|nr:DUF362 domain-containing protein [Candidatus Bathyarchaeota archaeon]